MHVRRNFSAVHGVVYQIAHNCNRNFIPFDRFCLPVRHSLTCGCVDTATVSGSIILFMSEKGGEGGGKESTCCVCVGGREERRNEGQDRCRLTVFSLLVS